MKSSLLMCLLVSLICASQGYGQALFPVKFDGCKTDQFSLERDTTTAKISNEAILTAIQASLDKKVMRNIKGELMLQIIVDLDGSSCLISMKNDTNIPTKKLPLKETLDEQLQWQPLSRKFAALVALQFRADGIRVYRMGMDARKGLHLLAE